MTLVFRNYDQAELDRQYDQATLIPNPEKYLTRANELSKAARDTLACETDIAYGPSSDETLDVFPIAGGSAPVQVLIHGGAWTRGHKDSFSFPASAYVPNGVVCVVTNFSVAPAVTLGEMVRQNRAAIAWTYRNIAKFGGDPDRIYVNGFSSGSHIAAMMAVTDWQKTMDVPADTVKGATTLSGLYELEPVRLSHRNSYLHLDDAAVEELSPIRHIPDRRMPLVLGYGLRDLDEFQRQGKEFAEAWQARGHPTTTFTLPGHLHFDVQLTMAEPDSLAIRSTLKMMGVTG